MQWRWTALALAASIGFLTLEVLAAPRPNVVLILADDLGYSDIGSYGGEIRTPNLDRLASKGVRFTQFYTTPRCSPSRASILTGLDPHEAGVGHLADLASDRPGYRGELGDHTVTVAEVLRSAGYRSYLSGKWHLTRSRGDERGSGIGSDPSWPLARGFDRFYGTLRGAGSYFDPVSLVRDRTALQPEGDHYYYTDAISEQAVRFITDHVAERADEPFFLYLAYTAPHWPMHAPAEQITRYEGEYPRGWDAVRAERYRRMVSLGIVESDWALSPRDAGVPAWPDAEHRTWQARRMQVYAAMVERMDRGIGEVLGALERAGLVENTLVFFLSDNGGCAEELTRRDYWLRRALGLWVPDRTRDGRTIVYGNDPAVMPGPEDTYQSYGRGWANASNTPFRLYKSYTHEGGITTPLIVHWPKGLRVQEGALIRAPGHVVDLSATIFDVAGADYPTRHRGHDVRALRGESLLPLLEGGTRQRRPIFWEHEGNRAVRDGRWKLVSGWRGDWELYDMEADRTELRDLAAQEPARVSELAALYDAWEAEVGVQSWPWLLSFVRKLLWVAALIGVCLIAAVWVLLRRRAERAAT